jgi:hypothetical protein
MRAKHQHHRVKVICSHTTDIGRTLAMEDFMMIGKFGGIKRLYTSFDVGNYAPEGRECCHKYVPRLSGTNDDFGRYQNTAVLRLSALHPMHKGSIP